MSKKTGIIFVTIGAVLILSALLLFLSNELEDYRAGQSAERLVDDIQSVMEEQKDVPETNEKREQEDGKMSFPEEIPPTEVPAQNSEEDSQLLSGELPVVVVDGYEYIGYLTIPEFELELPVMAQWDYKRLKLAPCRQSGSARTDDLVIAAHNYKRHFGRLSKLEIGASIYFTDVNGEINQYILVRLETLPPDSVDVVLHSGHDLVLYTCTLGGATRVVAFFDRSME